MATFFGHEGGREGGHGKICRLLYPRSGLLIPAINNLSPGRPLEEDQKTNWQPRLYKVMQEPAKSAVWHLCSNARCRLSQGRVKGSRGA